MSVSMSGSVITFSDSSTMSTNPVPSGTVMVFYQASAPTGWTQYTSLNDYALRIVSGTGGGTGGSSGFSTAFATPSVSVGGLSAGATTLSTGQMPSHNHQEGLTPVSCGCGTACRTPYYQAYQRVSPKTPYCTSSTGGGGSHTHSISGSATTSINVQYANHILATKN